MLSNKEIVCPNNLLDVAHQKKGVAAGIVNAGKSITMMSVMDAVNENLITPVFIGNKANYSQYVLESGEIQRFVQGQLGLSLIHI